MIQLYDTDSQTLLGQMTEPQLQFLIEQLEEESSEDQDYYINRATLEMLAEAGAEPELLALLQRGLGARDEMEIRWVRT